MGCSMFGLQPLKCLIRRTARISTSAKPLGTSYWILGSCASAKYHHSPGTHVCQTRMNNPCLFPLAAGTGTLKAPQVHKNSFNLELKPSENILEKEYVLPSLIKSNLSILDPVVKSSVDLPPMFQHKFEIFVPALDTVQKVIEDPLLEKDSIGGKIIEKHAKNVLKYRRRKMNRHKLKKLRKRMKFVYIRKAQRKAKLREKMLQKMQDDIIQYAKDWDPRKEADYVLERARKGGFRIDLFTGEVSTSPQFDFTKQKSKTSK